MEVTLQKRCEESNERVSEEKVQSIIFSKKNIVSAILLVVKLVTFFVRKHKSE